MLTDIPDDTVGDEDEPAAALPRLLEDLTEEEAYLVAILTDVSGIDIAEFAFTDEEQDDGCYRAYPFQHCWWRNSDEQQIEQGARSTGKCVAGSTLVRLADGSEQPIASLVDQTPDLACYDADLHSSTGKAFSIFASGRKPVSTVATRLGKKVDASAAHRFLTVDGWCRLDELQVGDVVATAGDVTVCWDRIDAITPAGETATYDITMAGEPNFVADGFVVHNSEGIKNAACAVPFNYPGEEHVITAPENKHVERLTDRIEEQITSTRLLREMVVGGRSGINHRPFFKVRWKTGARLITVIPQISGQGLKGIHPAKLDIDEAQDFPSQGWKEVRETLKKHVKNAMWRVHGVTTGIPNDFHKMTQPEVPFSIRPYRSSMGFTVHRITAYHKPTWTEQEREDKIRQYGSRNSPEYRRNVLGMHGDAANPIFVTTRLLGNTDTNEGSDYNRENYWKKEVRFEQIEDLAERQKLGPEDYGRLLIDMLDFPAEHRRYEVFWAGMDVGIARDPSEVVVFGEYVPKAAERRQDERNGIAVPLEGDTRLRLLTRFHMLRFPTTVQVEALMAIVSHYRPRAMSLDATGNGLGLLQQLQQLAHRSRIMRVEIEPEDDDEEAQAAAKAIREASKKEPAGQALTVIKGYNFGGKVVVEIDEEKAAELPAGVKPDELAEKAGIKRLVKEYATDKCRDLVDAKRLMLPYDENLLAQMNGQTWVYSSQPTDAYGNRRRTYSRGEFHCFDAIRMAVLGYSLQPIEQLLKAPPKKRAPVYDRFL